MHLSFLCEPGHLQLVGSSERKGFAMVTDSITQFQGIEDTCKTRTVVQCGHTCTLTSCVACEIKGTIRAVDGR